MSVDQFDLRPLPLSAEHIPLCAPIWGDRRLAEQPDFPTLLAKARTLLKRRMARGALLVDQNGRVRYFGLTAFVTPNFAATFVQKPQAQLGARLLREWPADTGGPILGEAAIGRGNAGRGLCLAVLSQGWDVDDAGADPWPALFGAVIEQFIHVHRGFKLSQIIGETFDAIGVDIVRTADAFAMYRTHNVQLSSGAALPSIVYSLTREEARQRWSVLMPMFRYTRPRICFAKSERVLLTEALLTGTNAALAARLGISPAAVTACWTRALRRVAKVAPHVLNGATPRGSAVRGGQKRHLLLQYVRDHPSELTPYSGAPKQR